MYAAMVACAGTVTPHRPAFARTPSRSNKYAHNPSAVANPCHRRQASEAESTSAGLPRKVKTWWMAATPTPRTCVGGA